MPKDLRALKEERAEVLTRAKSIVEKADEEGRSLSEDEVRQISEMRTEASNRMKEIEAREELEAELMRKIVDDTRQKQEDGNGKFESLGEFVRAVITSPHDPRLRELSVGGSGSDALVPMEFASTVMEAATQASIVEPNATVIPAGEKPDASITIPAVDYSSNMYGGVEVAWIGEGATKEETDMSFTDIELNPKEIAAHVVVTDRLLRNAPVVETILNKMLGGAIAAAKDNAFFNSAVSGPTGIIGHAGTVKINRTTANSIEYADLCNLYGSFAADNGIWVCANTALPTLMQMEDGGGHLIWQANAAVSPTGTILGSPLRKSFRVPTLGNEGDIGLYDFSAYLIKEGYGLAIGKSEHVYYTRNKTVVKAFLCVDGAPWLAAPLTEEDGSKVGPFVVLDDIVSS